MPKPLVPTVLVTVLLAAGGGFLWLRARARAASEPRPARVQVAQEKGCFACHGPGGLRGMAEPRVRARRGPAARRRARHDVRAGRVASCASGSSTGHRSGIRDDPDQWKLRERAIVQMPAWRSCSRRRRLEALVAYVKAVSDLETPKDEKADAGRRTAQRLGCFNCHGPQGRGSQPNPRSPSRASSPPGTVPTSRSWRGTTPRSASGSSTAAHSACRTSRARASSSTASRSRCRRTRATSAEAEVGELLAYIGWVRQHPY